MKFSYSLEVIRKSGLINYLIEEFNYPESIILFGSFRKSENNFNSDIDLLIISPVKKRINLEKFEKKLNHKIQLFMYSRKEIENLKIKNKEILNSFVNGFNLYGFWEVFV